MIGHTAQQHNRVVQHGGALGACFSVGFSPAARKLKLTDAWFVPIVGRLIACGGKCFAFRATGSTNAIGRRLHTDQPHSISQPHMIIAHGMPNVDCMLDDHLALV